MRSQLSESTSIEYDDVGQGKPIVLLHAFPLCRAMWRPQVAALQSDLRVLVPDLRGFGGTSPFASTPSVEQMADDILGLLDVLAIKQPVILGGLSMGGYVAFAFARKYPSRLRALILADTRAEADSPEAKANREVLIAFAETHTSRDVIDQMLPRLIGQNTRTRCPEVEEEVRRLGAAQTPKGIVAALQALRDRPNALSVLPSIQVPTLVLVGSEDALTPPSVSQTLAAGIRGARLKIVNGAGHLANLEQPEAFNEAMATFLKSLG